MNQALMSADSQAVLLLCSTLATGRGPDALKPLSRSEWNDIARAIGTSSLRRPGALLGLRPSHLQAELGVVERMAERMAALMDRGGQLAIELERLQGLGIWAVTRADEEYPSRLRERLKAHAPAVLFGAGDRALLSRDGVAIVGSRNVDGAGGAFATSLGEQCAASNLLVISGGARGVDRLAMAGALEAGGAAVGVLADSLEDAIRRRESRSQLLAGRLTLVTPVHPAAKFTVGAAMGRNKLIYALSSCAVVVAADLETGGTWAGAVENLRAAWVPLFVRHGDGVPEGNLELIRRGAKALTAPEVPELSDDYSRAAPDPSIAVREIPVPYPGPPAGDEQASATDLFDHVWPLLRKYLSEPRTEAHVAETFDLHKGQAKAWLARAVKAGLARKLTKPVRYEATPTQPQNSLF